MKYSSSLYSKIIYIVLCLFISTLSHQKQEIPFALNDDLVGNWHGYCELTVRREECNKTSPF